MGIQKQPPSDEQIELLLDKNRDLIEALKSLRKKLGGKDPDQTEENDVVAEETKPDLKEDNQ